MNKLSRRQLASYAVEQMLAGAPPRRVSERLVAELQYSGRRREAHLLVDDIYATLESRGILSRADVSSAHPMNSALKSKVERFIKAFTGANEVQIHENTDKELIGGLKIETPGFSWDNTVKTRLKKLVNNKKEQ